MTKQFTATTTSIATTGTVCLWHGTDEVSASLIIKHGVSEEFARLTGGQGEFWATLNPDEAWWFAQTGPGSDRGEPRLLKFDLPNAALNVLIGSDPPLVVERIESAVFEFLPDGFSVVNEAMLNLQAITSLEEIRIDL